MKKIILLSLISTVAVIFTACSNEDAHFEGVDINNTIAINVTCTTPASIGTYIDMQSNDVIVKEDSNTSVSIFHDQDNNKKVCLVSGSAYIIRN